MRLTPGSRFVCRLAGLGLFVAFPGLLSAQARTPVPVRFGEDTELSGGQPASLPQIEPTIAVNPRDPKNLVAGYFGRTSAQSNHPCFVVFTMDGGATWSPAGTTPLAADVDYCFDPSLAADSDGNFYYSYLDIRADPQGHLVPDVRVAKSTDGGRTFTQSSVAVMGGFPVDQPEPDKEWIAVDTWPKSRFRGTVYVSFTDSTDLGQGLGVVIRIVVSRNRGRTWSSPVAVSRFVSFDANPFEGVQDSLPVVAPDGTAYVFYQDFSHLTQRMSIKYSKSKDGGKSWSAPADVAANLPSPGFFLLDNGDTKFASTAGVGIYASSYPTAAIAPDGTIYVAWTDFPDGRCVAIPDSFGFIDNACVNADVRLAFSRDGGRGWSAPLKVSDDATTTDQFFPWIAAHPGGLLSLIWQDRRLDLRNLDYDIFYTNTPDGQVFLPNVRVTTATSKVDQNNDQGDYNNLAVTGDSIFPIWNDQRFNSVQIFTVRGIFAP